MCTNQIVQLVSLAEKKEGESLCTAHVECRPNVIGIPEKEKREWESASKELIERLLLRHVSNEQLYLPGKEYAWSLRLDLMVLDLDGNHLDAMFLAGRAALMSLQIPGVRSRPHRTGSGSEMVLDPEAPPLTLKLDSVPLSVTLGVVGDHLLVDPTKEENFVVETFLTMCIDRENEVVSIEKRGKGGFPICKLDEAGDMASHASHPLYEALGDGA